MSAPTTPKPFYIPSTWKLIRGFTCYSLPRPWRDKCGLMRWTILWSRLSRSKKSWPSPTKNNKIKLKKKFICATRGRSQTSETVLSSEPNPPWIRSKNLMTKSTKVVSIKIRPQEITITKLLTTSRIHPVKNKKCPKWYREKRVRCKFKRSLRRSETPS